MFQRKSCLVYYCLGWWTKHCQSTNWKELPGCGVRCRIERDLYSCETDWEWQWRPPSLICYWYLHQIKAPHPLISPNGHHSLSFTSFTLYFFSQARQQRKGHLAVVFINLSKRKCVLQRNRNLDIYRHCLWGKEGGWTTNPKEHTWKHKLIKLGKFRNLLQASKYILQYVICFFCGLSQETGILWPFLFSLCARSCLRRKVFALVHYCSSPKQGWPARRGACRKWFVPFFCSLCYFPKVFVLFLIF